MWPLCPSNEEENGTKEGLEMPEAFPSLPFLEVEMDEAYETLAEVYDEFMDNVEYEVWADCLAGILKGHGIPDGLVLDLGCGTGTMTELLAKKGYDMIGVDHSVEMLMRAQEKKGDLDILYLAQEMTGFELYGSVRAIVSVCDSLNYLTEEEDLLQTFRLAENYLDPGGLLIFDMNTRYKYEEVIGDSVIAETREDACFIWENTFDEESWINQYLVTLFVRREDGLYERHEEVHVQRAYIDREVHELLREAGLTLLEITDAYTGRPPREDSQRLLFVAQKTRGLSEDREEGEEREG